MAMWEVDRDTSDFSYRLCLSVNFIWPLLVDRFSESEKLGYRVMVARVMLHELAVRVSFTTASACSANSQPELACLQL